MEKLKGTYVVREFWLNFLFSFVFFSSVFLIEGIIRVVELLVQRVFSILTVLDLLMISFAVALPYVLPLAFLSSVTALFTRMAADREILILSTSGIQPLRLVRRLLPISLAGCLFLFYCNFAMTPLAKYRKRTLILGVKFHNPLLLLKEKTSVTEIPGASIYVEKIGGESVLSNLILSYTDRAGTTHMIRAREGNAVFRRDDGTIVFSLKDGILLTYRPEDVRSLVKVKFEDYEFSLPLPSDYRMRMLPKVAELSLLRLMGMSRGTSENIEIQKRTVFSITPLLFLFLGAGLGVRIRQKSRTLHIGLGAFTSLAFFELVTAGEILAYRVDRPELLWLPAAVFGIADWAMWK